MDKNKIYASLIDTKKKQLQELQDDINRMRCVEKEYKENIKDLILEAMVNCK